VVFWSPDSRSIFYSVKRNLKRANLESGSTRSIATLPYMVSSGTWRSNGDLLVYMGHQNAYELGIENGALRQLPNPADLRLPQFLPQSDLHVIDDPASGRWRAQVTDYANRERWHHASFARRVRPVGSRFFAGWPLDRVRFHGIGPAGGICPGIRSHVVGKKRQVSREGAWMVRWRPDGRELFYLGVDNWLHAAPVGAGSQIGDSKPLFRIEGNARYGTTSDFQFDVSRDGQRIIMSTTGSVAPPAFTVIRAGRRNSAAKAVADRGADDFRSGPSLRIAAKSLPWR
jgi:hypothetical protein